MKAIESLKKMVLKYGWEMAGIATLLFIVLINIFPSGHIIDSGDVAQFLDLKQHYVGKIFYDSWMLGRTMIFFGIFYFLDLLNISDTGQLSWYLGVFLFGAYFSFRIFCWNTFPHLSKPVTVLMSFFYAANIYTLYIFTSTWGFTSYQILYVFIPVLTGLYMRALHSERRAVIWFLLVAFFASMSFSNPAFAVSSAIYLFLLTVALFLSGIMRSDRTVWQKIAVIAIGATLLNIYWILPLIPKAGAGIEELSSSEVIVLPETLRKTSNAIFDSIRMMQTSEQEAYYPVNFPYPSFDWMKPVVSMLAFVPFFLILLGFFQKRERESRKLYFVFFSLLVVFIMLVARVRFPFDPINDFLFQLPVMNALRGYDKLAIFVPFIMSSLLLMVFSDLRGVWLRKSVFVIFPLLSVVLALPFFFGGLQTKLSQALAHDGDKDFRKTSYSSLVKIPDPYYAIVDIFNEDKEENKISMLPYSPGSSVGKVSLPVWKVNGPSVAYVLYKKQYVELSGSYIPGWAFAEDLADTENDPQWITDLYGLIGIKYVIFHKDAKPNRVQEMEKTRKYLEETGALEPIVENDFFRLYKIREDDIFPYVYGCDGRVSFAGKEHGLSKSIETVQSGVRKISYEKANPGSIMIAVQDLDSQKNIVLNEKYDPLWAAEYETSTGERVPLVRDDRIRYANAWKLDKMPGSAKIEIYYMPFRLLWIGMWTSGITLVGVVFGLVYFSKKRA